MLGSPPLVRHGPASLVPARARPQLVSPALGRQRCNQRSGLKIGPAWSRSPHPVRVNLDHPLKSNSQASRSEGCKRSSSPGNPNLNSTSSSHGRAGGCTAGGMHADAPTVRPSAPWTSTRAPSFLFSFLPPGPTCLSCALAVLVTGVCVL